MIIKYLIAALLASLPFAGWKTYTNKEAKYTIRYPEEWTQTDMQTATAFVSPKTSSDDTFQENVNVVVQDLGKMAPALSEFTELILSEFNNKPEVYSDIVVQDTKLAGYDAKEMKYTMQYIGQALKIKQMWFLKEGKAYLFTYIAMPDQFDEYEKTATEIIQSFSFKK